MPSGPKLPTNNDQRFDDSSTQSAKEHQQQHDTVDATVNQLGIVDVAGTLGADGYAVSVVSANDGDALVYDPLTQLYVPGRPKPRARDITVQAITTKAGITTLDLSKGVIVDLTLGANTTLAYANLLPGEPNYIELLKRQDSTGNRTLTLWSGIVWAGGVPSWSVAANSVDRVLLTTYNGGANWFGDVIGLNYK